MESSVPGRGWWPRRARFDPSRGNLATYLRLRARSRALDVVRSNHAAGRLVSRLRDLPGAAGAHEDAAQAVQRRHDGRLVCAGCARTWPPRPGRRSS